MADSFAVGQIVGDDFSQLGKMPAVPFSAAHDVVVKLFIQVIQKTWSYTLDMKLSTIILQLLSKQK